MFVHTGNLNQTMAVILSVSVLFRRHLGTLWTSNIPKLVKVIRQFAKDVLKFENKNIFNLMTKHFLPSNVEWRILQVLTTVTWRRLDLWIAEVLLGTQTSCMYVKYIQHNVNTLIWIKYLILTLFNNASFFIYFIYISAWKKHKNHSLPHIKTR